MEKTKINNRELTKEIKEALNNRYALPEWCFLTEVPNATGLEHSRSIDGLALNLFPSKNYQKIAFEIKTIRSDLLKELKDGSKSDAIAKYCDNFYLVIPKTLSLDGLEIPNSWGILVYNNKKLRQIKKAEIIKNKESLNDGMFAGILQALIRKHGEEYFKKEAEIKKTVFADFDMKLKAKEDLIKNTISKDKSNKLEFDKFMEIVKNNSLLVSFNSKILFDYLIQGIVLSKIKTQMQYSINVLDRLKKDFVLADDEADKIKNK